jgi:hypothetical protein
VVSRDALRQAMPTVAALVDELRPFMGKGAKVIYASEGGHVIDRREPVNPDAVFDIPKDYAPTRKVATKEGR